MPAVAPAYPAALLGTRAPIMLAYLPPYHHSAPTVRAIIQTEGYEMDTLRGYADSLSLATNPNACPEWMLAVWEAVLGTPTRSTWAAADRRAALLWFTPSHRVRTEQDAIDFAAAQTASDPADITLSQVGLAYNYEYSSATAPADEVAYWLGQALPAHIALTEA